MESESHQLMGDYIVSTLIGGWEKESRICLLRLSVQRQVVFPLIYEGEMACAYVADIVVENTVILELKSVKALSPVMEAQLINYLRLSRIPVGYLINFNGSRMVYRRRVLSR